MLLGGAARSVCVEVPALRLLHRGGAAAVDRTRPDVGLGAVRFCGWRALACAAGSCLAVVLLGSSASAATPAPAPAVGSFHASAWECDNATAVAPVDASGSTGSGRSVCSVTAWALETAPTTSAGPAPVVIVNPSPVPVAEAHPVATGTGGLSSDQFGVLSFTGGLLVFLGAAHVIGSWKS